MALNVLFVGLICVHVVWATILPRELNVGGIFEQSDDNLKAAFELAIDRINANASILPRTRLVPIVYTLERSDSFTVSRKVCELLQNDVIAIYGPQSIRSSSYVKSVCSALHMPHFQTRWDQSIMESNSNSISMAPSPSILGKALGDLVVKKNWKNFAILYSEDSSMVLIQEILKNNKMHSKKIIIRKARETNDNYQPYSRSSGQKLTSQSQPSFREILKELFKMNVKNMIVDVPRDQVLTVLGHAKDVNMLRVYNSYIFTALDLHTVDLKQYHLTGTNISAFSLVDINHSMMINQGLTTEAAYLFDSIELLARSLAELNSTALPQISYSELKGPQDIPLTATCAWKSEELSNQLRPWSVGSLLRRYMGLRGFEGLTGYVEIHEKGFREKFTLRLYDLTLEGLKSVADWKTERGLDFIGNYSIHITENYKELLKNRTLVIVTLENKPYVAKVEGWQNKTGNDRWEGYCVDLIKELAEITSFKWDLRVLTSESGSHGTKNDKGEWTGLVRELIEGKADISVADLTITYERESVVDFTMPFMSLGIGILVKKPTKASPKLFEFMLPLAPEVWVYLLTAFFGVTLFKLFVARFSPYEWVNPHPCELDAEKLSNDFTMKNTLWFTIGCLMQQGCDIMPRALSTRVMAAAWWFFILILVSSYTANLAAFLTVERMDNPIQSADDLAKQTKVLYGCLKSGSTRDFFQRSNYTTYARMWSFMESRRAETLLESNDKGVERVKKGDFAFLMESTTIEYTVERNCDLSQVGSLLDQKGYGIATQQDSPYRAVLSEAILTLQEKGVLHKLKDRWWKEKKESNMSCEIKEQQKSSGTASELGLDHVGGVFVVLGGGALISILICVGEYYWKHISAPSQGRTHMLVALARDLKRIFS